jgi:dihydrofolate synthase/folylpolyglutamate synthase
VAAPPTTSALSFTHEQAEDYLAGLEPIGWRFGLDRIRRLVSVLGMPQHRFASVHVVGTNGKSSVTEMTAAVLEAHGVRTGAYLSPHDERWSQRVRVGGGEIDGEAFAAAVERVARAVEVVNRALPDGEAVTQFEAATAAAFVALAAAGVEVAVIEAGLGGRLDATNVLPSRVSALTSVGLEHTEWLGETELEIAAEKLAVLRDHSMLVVGRVSVEVEELARTTATRRNARLVTVRGLGPGVELANPAPYQRRNFAVALACSDAVIDRLDPDRVRDVAAELELHGRMELIRADPPLILDAAHNPDGARALAEALPAFAAGRPVLACVAVLADKDSAGILGALAPSLTALVATEIPPERLVNAGRPGARSLPAPELADLARRAGMRRVEALPDPRAGLARAGELAAAEGGVVLVCGSNYLLRYAGARG